MPNSLPLRRRCPFPECPSNAGQVEPRVVRHSTYMTRRGRRRRMLCKVCGRTFSTTLGTPYYRLRRSRNEFDETMRMQVEGLPQAAIARVKQMTPSTVGRWRERAAQHMALFTRDHLALRDPVELQMDELRAHGTGNDRTWVYSGLEVWSRLWSGLRVGNRTLRNTALFVRGVRAVCPPTGAPPLVTSDEQKYYEPVMRNTFGPCAYVQLNNRYARGRILRSDVRLVLGPDWRFEAAMARSEDSRRPNTAYVERLNLYTRRACSYVHRRTSGRMRKPQLLAQALELLRGYYNFIRPHASLRFGRVTRTPAMQGGLFKRALSFREIFSWVPGPDRRPAPVKMLPRGAQ